MTLSMPIFHLKRDARRMAREQSIPLHAALDRVAAREGMTGWSLLASRHAARSPARELYDQLSPGDMILIGARPGHGKTLMALALATEAVRDGHEALFFTLDYTETDIAGRLAAIDFDPATAGSRFSSDCSDRICAAYIIDRLQGVATGTVVVIDYLQLLDQRREHPPLAEQVGSLKTFAAARGVIMVFIAQIDRTYDPAGNALPTMADVRLPNPLDLSVFTRACFMHRGNIQIHALP